MKLKKFKEKDHKRIGIIGFTIVCILLVSGVILYRTFAIFEVRTRQNVIKGTVQDPGNIYFAFYVNNEIQNEMPQQGSGYILDEGNSYCGVTGENDSNIKVALTEDWKIVVSGVTSSRTKCNLKFVKGAYILGKPVIAVTSGNGLYEVPHGDEVFDTLNDAGFKQTEWRYAGASPNNYVTFNDETWRIIGLVNVKTTDGEIKQRVKIIKNESIGRYSWDSSEAGVNDGYGVNEWSKSDLNNELNNYYLNSKNETCYNARNNVSTNCDFTNTGIKEKYRDFIENITWNTGAYNGNNDINVQYYYQKERGNDRGNDYCNTNQNCNDSVPRTTTSNGKVGLLYASDYFYAMGGTQRIQCLQNPDNACFSDNWLNKEKAYHLITPLNNTREAGYVHLSITMSGLRDSAITSSADEIYPTLYLKPNLKILNDDQDGSESKPYNLKLVE